MNYRTETIEISGDSLTIKIPLDEIYEDAIYDDQQATKTIYLNLDDRLKDMVSMDLLETLIDLQGDYIAEQQKLNEPITIMGESNIDYLRKKMAPESLDLSTVELIEIFDVEMIYLKLINVIK